MENISQNAMKYCMRGKGGSPKDKPQVYFAYHPLDYKLYFREITDKILEYADCAVFYHEEPENADRNELLFQIKQMQLIVIPVTSNFLFKDCIARQVVFDFAMKEHIPVLPILEESERCEDFNRICGNLQYLDPHQVDMTARSFDDKLKKYLDSVLIGSELAEKVRAAFEAYIFLSYRKKDRRVANELMQLIHRNEFCRDIAIWYDEYLVPGEDFNDTILAALQKSDLFMLTVTPNIVEPGNYVIQEEYPRAVEAGKPILPVEMEKTDLEELGRSYENIPEAADTSDEEGLTAVLLQALNRTAKMPSDDPQHIYFIGLAYLGGIDVEVDRPRGVSLITRAAERGLEEAVKKLVDMYHNGDNVELDYEKAIQWQKRLVEIRKENFARTGEEEDELKLAIEIGNLASLYGEIAIYSKSLEFNLQALAINERLKGTDDLNTATIYNNIGIVYHDMGEYEKALEMYTKALEIEEKNSERITRIRQ